MNGLELKKRGNVVWLPNCQATIDDVDQAHRDLLFIRAVLDLFSSMEGRLDQILKKER